MVMTMMIMMMMMLTMLALLVVVGILPSRIILLKLGRMIMVLLLWGKLIMWVL